MSRSPRLNNIAKWSTGFAPLSSWARNLWIIVFTLLFSLTPLYSQTKSTPEYLWYEAENMRGFTTGKLGAPTLNPSYLNLSRDKAPGWGMNGPGVSAEWTQGGESEWNSAAAAADETHATLYQDLEIPRLQILAIAHLHRISKRGRQRAQEWVELGRELAWTGPARSELKDQRADSIAIGLQRFQKQRRMQKRLKRRVRPAE